ncbi:Ig-like domain-containing protein [Mesorhizobium huakuii]|uniref:Dystroglycan-type cadherin-like domain-containing protein n=1 Tax=Mesorhizobium huakuii TaxID=28104 RepID=A0A7G6T071_9HYPH|nr:Ig-like domain-containing protein [Mesorhizobium huakuii]QND60153.1 hypothetical protein HB778_29120 [Mesorhizobium huakuii]
MEQRGKPVADRDIWGAGNDSYYFEGDSTVSFIYDPNATEQSVANMDVSKLNDNVLYGQNYFILNPEPGDKYYLNGEEITDFSVHDVTTDPVVSEYAINPTHEANYQYNGLPVYTFTEWAKYTDNLVNRHYSNGDMVGFTYADHQLDDNFEWTGNYQDRVLVWLTDNPNVSGPGDLPEHRIVFSGYDSDDASFHYVGNGSYFDLHEILDAYPIADYTVDNFVYYNDNGYEYYLAMPLGKPDAVGATSTYESYEPESANLKPAEFDDGIKFVIDLDDYQKPPAAGGPPGTGPDNLVGGPGDNQLDGGGGNDTYIYALGDGHDVITEAPSNGDDDALVFTNINAADVTLIRDYDDVTVVVAESSPGASDGGSILLRDSLADNLGQGVDKIVFADNTVWTRADMIAHADQWPIISEGLPDYETAVGASFTAVLPPDAFYDPDGQTLALSAKLADGSALPTWLAFDANTHTLSGLAPVGSEGVVEIAITADDGTLQVSDTLSLVIGSADSWIAHDDRFWTSFETSLAVDITANDTIPGGANSDAYLYEQPDHGSVVWNGTGYTYTPDAGFTGVDWFYYGLFNADNNDQNMTPDNPGVAIVHVGQTVDPDDHTGVTGSIGTGNDSYFGGSSFDDTALFTGGNTSFADGKGGDDTMVFSGDVADYQIQGNGDHFWIYQTANASTDVIEITNFEHLKFGDTGKLAISDIIAAAGHEPGDVWPDSRPINVPHADSNTWAANDDRYWTTAGTAVVLNMTGNDTIPTGAHYDAAVWDQPQHGTIAFNGTDYVYTPDTGFTGVDWFTYALTDPDNNDEVKTDVPGFGIIHVGQAYDPGNNQGVSGSVGAGDSFGGSRFNDTINYSTGDGPYIDGKGGDDIIVFNGDIQDYRIQGNGNSFWIYNDSNPSQSERAMLQFG